MGRPSLPIFVMIKADLHNHTCYSHGCNTPAEMYGSACSKGLSLIGFSEHSPRPEGYNYTHEYRKKLAAYLPDYVAEVSALKNNSGSCKVLLGLEMDWLAGQEAFIAQSIKAHDYDYIIGSVHFLDHWGFDDGAEPWQNISQETCENRYRAYFHAWQDMLASGFFQIAAHPDLIKIHSCGNFRVWLQKPEAIELIAQCLHTLKASGMAMEISSAGVRKPCAEIYPAREIMELARQTGVEISMASDAHCVRDVGADFERLADYARSYGFGRQAIFDHGAVSYMPF